jgi:predicted metalloprotease with PDZ domain
MTIAAEGKLSDVLWEGPAYKIGLTVGTQIIAVNGIAYDAERLKSAIRDANKTNATIELLVKNGDRYRTVKFDYHDGLRYPHLDRESSVPARLDQILAPRI